MEFVETFPVKRRNFLKFENKSWTAKAERMRWYDDACDGALFCEQRKSGYVDDIALILCCLLDGGLIQWRYAILFLISVNVVMGTHYLLTTDYSLSFVASELAMITIGTALALLMNWRMPSNLRSFGRISREWRMTCSSPFPKTGKNLSPERYYTMFCWSWRIFCL